MILKLLLGIVLLGLLGCSRLFISDSTISQRNIAQAKSVEEILKKDKYSQRYSALEHEAFHQALSADKRHLFALALKDNILYIRITLFDKNILKRLKDSIEKYPHTQGIIIDLRNNPGGVLKMGIACSNLFITKGVLLHTQGKLAKDTKDYFADKSSLTTAPIVILINKHTISASEIFAGILQEKHRALLVGEQSFGKGSIQEMVEIEENSYLKFTVATYTFANAQSIEGIGLTPDVSIQEGKISKFSRAITLKQKKELKAIVSKKADLFLLLGQKILSFHSL